MIDKVVCYDQVAKLPLQWCCDYFQYVSKMGDDIEKNS